MENIEYILVGIIAVFIILQLIRVLGKRSDADEEQILKKDAMFQELEAQRNARQLEIDLANQSKKESPEIEVDTTSMKYLTETYGELLAENIKTISGQQKNFVIEDFINNSKVAFSMIQDAFSNSDKDTLKLVLNDKMYNMYAKAIDDNYAKNITPHVEIVKIKDATLKSIDLLDGHMANITMEFNSEQTNYITDGENTIISGHDNQIISAKEIWTFERNLKETSNRWYLTKTKNIT